jgi:hypothetical protein
MPGTDRSCVFASAVQVIVTTDPSDPGGVFNAKESLLQLLEGTTPDYVAEVGRGAEEELKRLRVHPTEARRRVRLLLSPQEASQPPKEGGADPDRPRLVRTLAEIQADPEALKPPEPVIPRLAWKGRLSLFAAREKLGKSTMAALGCACVSRGGRFLEERCPAGPVLWVGLEEAVGDAARRFTEFKADPERIYIVDRLPEPFPDLEASVRHSGAGLVVVDSLAAFSEGMVSDPGSSAQWTPVMGRLARLARDSGAAVLLLHHARKSDGKPRDSTAILAGVDVIIEMHDGEEASVRKFIPKGRWGMDAFSAAFDGSDYRRTAGELSLDARVELAVRQSPGCSMRQLRERVQGKAEAIGEAATRLLAAGAIKDLGVNGARSFYPVEPGEPLGLPFDGGEVAA